MRLTVKDFRLGERVTVLRPYIGGGKFGADGFEGNWFVAGSFPGSTDLKLARNLADARDGDYDVIINLCRVKQANWYPEDDARSNPGGAL